MKSLFSSENGASSSGLPAVPTKFRDIAGEFVTSVREKLSANEVRALAASPVASPVLQVGLDPQRGERQLSATEKNDPPKSESELRSVRLRKEREWRNELQGWEVLRTDVGVEWSEAFRGALRVLEEKGQRERLGRVGIATPRRPCRPVGKRRRPEHGGS